ncbi:hypothetical protein CDAR_237411 [Caerostris darwini]|uniref:Ycf1 n=1 Tax=Caerostris darwini TaxID=1538125 RepID=A0AAV4QVS4_9ARAC|nr:hypothetical protein CDAR_237411 [Caerostris darwini]
MIVFFIKANSAHEFLRCPIGAIIQCQIQNTLYIKPKLIPQFAPLHTNILNNSANPNPTSISLQGPENTLQGLTASVTLKDVFSQRRKWRRKEKGDLNLNRISFLEEDPMNNYFLGPHYNSERIPFRSNKENGWSIAPKRPSRGIPPPDIREQLVFLNGTISWSCGHTQIRCSKKNKSFRGFHAYDPNT